MISSKPDANRTAIAHELCDLFGFFDARSKSQLSRCLKAFRDLDSAGLIKEE